MTENLKNMIAQAHAQIDDTAKELNEAPATEAAPEPTVATKPSKPRIARPLGTNPKDLVGIKKVRLGLVPPSSIAYQALAMQDGAVKYGPYNWRANKVQCTIYLDAALRHLFAYLDGEDLASDSKKPHLGHALACIGIIVDAYETGNLVDDRPAKGAASKVLARYEQKKEAPR